MLKTVVLSVRNGSFSLKKQRFLKRIPIFVGIKKVYHTDYQRILCNDKKQVFFVSKITRWKISAVFAVRTSILLNLFIYIVEA